MWRSPYARRKVSLVCPSYKGENMAVLEEDRTLAATSVPPSLATEIAKVMTEAANNAVEDVPAEIEALGASPTQARAVAQEVGLALRALADC